jgi:hypothetical protein
MYSHRVVGIKSAMTKRPIARLANLGILRLATLTYLLYSEGIKNE